MKSRLLTAILILCCVLLAGCVNTAAVPDPSSPLPTPEVTPTPEPTPTPEAEVTALPELADLNTEYDELGERITSAEHFKRYITFENIQVYEQHEDTFMDAIAVNEYTLPLVCGINIYFYDEDGAEIASSVAHTRDGQYVMKLQPGENTIFAQIDTDMKLTDKEFVLEFSEELTVLPE